MTENKKPGIEQLRDDKTYCLVRTLKHDEIVEFVTAELKKFRWPIVTFYIFNSVLLLIITAITAANVFHEVIPWRAHLTGLLAGTAAGILFVIPFHEGLHGLAYRIAGAGKIRYGMDLRQMLFYASAPGFVAGRNDFMIVAFLPFIVINLFFFAFIITGQQFMQWASLVAMLMHSTMCIGDFAMINFMAGFSGKDIYTYDDPGSETSYFYIRNRV
ncbi:MAG: DUF3267 domain-containing protein [Marinilabiliales bacterium]|nr:MAG: DUF3267 domain-containing protein [Marinilabiliales bacterium]